MIQEILNFRDRVHMNSWNRNMGRYYASSTVADVTF